MKTHQSRHEYGKPHSYKLVRRDSKHQIKRMKLLDSFYWVPLLKLALCSNQRKPGLAPKKILFYSSLSSQAVPFSAFSLGLARFSFCIASRENSEKSNHMLSATLHIELEFLTKYLNMSKLQNWQYKRVLLHVMFDEIMLIIIWPIYGKRLIIDRTIYGPNYSQPGTINIYGPVFDQLGIDFSLLWQSVCLFYLFLYGRETRVDIVRTFHMSI